GTRPQGRPGRPVPRSPPAVVGLEEIVERVRTQRERFGFSYFTVLEPCMEAFAPVIESLRGK
ncbi:hypothetical protein ACWDAF_38855, partial [Streptomyces sp. NPDC001226]